MRNFLSAADAEQTAVVASRPFFITTSLISLESVFPLHLTQ